MKSRPGQGLTVISKKIRHKQNDHASRRTQRYPHTRRAQHPVHSPCAAPRPLSASSTAQNLPTTSTAEPHTQKANSRPPHDSLDTHYVYRPVDSLCQHALAKKARHRPITWRFHAAFVRARISVSLHVDHPAVDHPVTTGANALTRTPATSPHAMTFATAAARAACTASLIFPGSLSYCCATAPASTERAATSASRNRSACG